MHDIYTVIPDPQRVVDEVLERATSCALQSRHHGPDHWRKVALAGARLLKRTPEADHAVVLLFALTHDSQRERRGIDPPHGPRAAELVRELNGELFHLSEKQLEQLCYALHYHESGATAGPESPTVGTCWDADRLNISRVGVWPKKRYLSTPAARGASTLVWAYELQQRRVTWEDVIRQYGLQRRRAMR